jgi:hypothetical protein
MRLNAGLIAGICLLVTALCAGLASAHSIPADQLDEQKIFYGSASDFETAAEVNYEAVVKATPEYEKIRKEKIDQGSAKYWILISQASDRALQAISSAGQDTSYDLIVSAGYLENIDPPVPADDITSKVLDYLES